MAGVIERSWSDLPVDILNVIVECLHYVDQIRFQLVCKTWRSTNPIKHADNLPWVMYINKNYNALLDAGSFEAFSKQYNGNGGLFYLYDPSQKKKYTLQNNILSGASVRASKHGWLLLFSWIPHSLFFNTPFTHKIVRLPELHMMDGCRIITATFSTAPTSPDCLIFVLTVSKKICVRTCSPRDKTWKNHWFDGDHGLIDSVAFVGGVLYCLFSKDHVMASFKVEQGERRIHPHPSPVTNNDTDFLIDHRLIESYDNNLLANCLKFDSPEQLFRYDQAEMRWLKVENLGDRMLFLGITSMSLPAVGEASALANTIHRKGPGCLASGLSYYFNEPRKRFLKTYNWIDKEDHSKKIWIQPIHHT